jgi:hypothetical protein
MQQCEAEGGVLNMAVTRRIFVSMPADGWLSSKQNELKWGIVDEIKHLDYVPEIFTNPKGMPGLASGKVWSRHDADMVMRKCVGAAIIGLPRWVFSTSDGQEIKLPTEYNQYEGALAYTLGLPMLVVGQEDMLHRVVFDQSYGVYMRFFLPDADRSWLDTEDFRVPFGYWKNELANRRDVFLGYSSSSKGTAQNLKRLLEKDLNVTVLDWKTDFHRAALFLNRSKKLPLAVVQEFFSSPGMTRLQTRLRPIRQFHVTTSFSRPGISSMQKVKSTC